MAEFLTPQSKALGEQKLLTLEPKDRWWFDKLVAGQLTTGFSSGTHPAWGPIPKATFQEDYIEAMKSRGVSRRASEAELGAFLRKVLPPGYPLISKPTNASGQQVPTYQIH